MYQHIMVPLDGSELAECVLPHVEAIAGGCNVTNVTLIRTITPFHLYAYAEDKLPVNEHKRLEALHMDKARVYLESIVARLKEKGITAQSKVLIGSEVNELVDYVAKNGVDLIVISTHGRSGISRWVWGSVADRLLRASCVPVMMVRAPGCVVGI